MNGMRSIRAKMQAPGDFKTSEAISRPVISGTVSYRGRQQCYGMLWTATQERREDLGRVW